MTAGPGTARGAGAAGHRLPRARRIPNRKAFLSVQEGGARVSTPHFLLLLAPSPLKPNQEPGASRLGITASRQVGNAVERNRAKRLVREVFRRAPDLLPRGVDLVVIVRTGAHRLSLEAATQEWRLVAGLVGRKALGLARRVRGLSGSGLAEAEGKAHIAPALVVARLLLVLIRLYQRALAAAR